MTTIKKIIENADNAYYATEYGEAIQLYKQALDLDADNKHARQQLRKAEFNWPLKSVKPEDLPTEALRLYKRSRSFITVGDLDGAKKLLQEAIDIAEEARVDFLNAKSLLENIQNALKAEEFKNKAYEELNTEQWVKAKDNLNFAIDLDPTDDTVQIQTLLLHLQGLLKARHLISRLEAGIEKARKRTEMIKEIREIIDLTNETAALSTLWQKVVRLFGDYNNINIVFRNRNMVFRWIMLFILSTSVLLLITFGFLYLIPRHRNVKVNCDAIASGLRAELDYPYYVADSDENKIEITFKNDSNSIVDDIPVEVKITGTAHFKYLDLLNLNHIKLDEIYHDRDQLVIIPFYVDGSTDTIPGPWYINFSVGACTPKDLHIAMSPIHGLGKFVGLLWSAVGLALIGLFNNRIKEFFEWLWSFFKKNST